MRKAGYYLAIFCATVLFSSIAAGQYSPTHYDYDEESVIDNEVWRLFTSIEGFNNTPNSAGFFMESGYVVLNQSGICHNVSYYSHYQEDYSDYDNQNHIIHNAIYTFNYTKTENNVSQNITVDSVSMGGYPGSVDITIWLDPIDTLHIFWMNSYDPEDVVKRFSIFHSAIDDSGEVMTENDMFYYEERGSGMPYNTTPYDVIVACLAILILLAFVLTRNKQKRNQK